MKLAVHWPPAVTVCTPGWTVAEAAGAQAPAVLGAIAAAAMVRAAMSTRAFLNTSRALPGAAENYARGRRASMFSRT
jgi:hypothetical protein